MPDIICPQSLWILYIISLILIWAISIGMIRSSARLSSMCLCCGHVCCLSFRSTGGSVNSEGSPTLLQPGYLPRRSGRDRLPPIAWMMVQNVVWIWCLSIIYGPASARISQASMQKRLNSIVSQNCCMECFKNKKFCKFLDDWRLDLLKAFFVLSNLSKFNSYRTGNTRNVSGTKTNWLMLFRKQSLFTARAIRNPNLFCGQDAEFYCAVELVVQIETTGI
jgi:hypothetical protein